MNDWIVWPVGIALWLAVGVTLFFVFEIPALREDHKPNQVTLSFFTWTLFEKFPLSIIYLVLNLGMLIGGLGVHFFWHWCPPGSGG